MVHDWRSELSGYVSGLVSAGQTVFSAKEAETARSSMAGYCPARGGP